MKKLWENYSYAMILLAVSLIFSFVAKAHLNNEDAYITVTIEEGQSLWEIAETFASEHNLSENEFVSWVEKENGIIGEMVFPGDELVIPVIAEQVEPTQIAGAER
ncbi:LysM peptidoglycan-binding domain-containing protein [Mesobacillus boroniphilus]|uniref:LysM peptidoglycan-binding domain-containing protein n=1 Tax=Mesobacillus boroniphilus TaxID=308892 RepID=A0A944CII2_9BACI|nr:LysM peptidoglycan-binding domain-containing protein [Mesobacillus boroniphilus]MBS8263638.1 LysM peptidoglycan-binding domain-containing protein [Mesobacillus boroniphilus]